LMACRRRPENAPIGWYAQVRAEMEQVIPQRLKEFWDADIRGADFSISAIGPSVGVFGRFRKVMRPDGQEVSVGELLDEVETIVRNFEDERFGVLQLDKPTRFYFRYRLTYGGDDLEFDEANKLAKSMGVELDALEKEDRLIKRGGKSVKLLTFVERWQDELCQANWKRAIENGQVVWLKEIDLLHIALGFWKRGELERLAEFLRQAGVLEEMHPFWGTAQAILEVERARKGRAVEEEVKALEQLLGGKRSVVRRIAALPEAKRQLELEF